MGGRVPRRPCDNREDAVSDTDTQTLSAEGFEDLPVTTRRVLAHPFSVQGAVVAVVEHGTAAEDRQLIEVLVGTRPQERPLVPGFGIPEQAFSGRFDVGALSSALAAYGPERRVVAGEATINDAQPDTITVRLELG